MTDTGTTPPAPLDYRAVSAEPWLRRPVGVASYLLAIAAPFLVAAIWIGALFTAGQARAFMPEVVVLAGLRVTFPICAAAGATLSYCVLLRLTNREESEWRILPVFLATAASGVELVLGLFFSAIIW